MRDVAGDAEQAAAAAAPEASLPPGRDHADNVPLGILSAIGAVFLFSSMNVFIKVMSADFHVLQLSFFRNFFALLPIFVLFVGKNPIQMLKTGRAWGHVYRTVVGTLTMVLVFKSLELLPLADAVALMFAAPLFTTALSVPLLKEPVGIRRWTAVLVGFVGVVIMAQYREPAAPSVDADFPLGVAAALGAAFGIALVQCQVRQLSATESSVAIVFYFTAGSTLLTGITLPRLWVDPSPVEWGYAVVMGIGGGIGQLMVTFAYSRAPAVVVSPFNYTSILWGTLFGWLIWNEVPGVGVWLGSAIVIASGIYIVWRETVKKRAVVATPPVKHG